jgi:hypothetical protein
MTMSVLSAPFPCGEASPCDGLGVVLRSSKAGLDDGVGSSVRPVGVVEGASVAFGTVARIAPSMRGAASDVATRG